MVAGSSPASGSVATSMRTLPGPLRPRVPLALAGNGPKAVRLAAELGDAWVTYGGRADTLEQWWLLVGELAERFAAAEAAAGRSGVARVLSMDSSPQFSLASPDVYEEMVGRAGELGFTDVVCHWPRHSGPYAGSEEVLEEVAGRIDLGGAEPMWGADVPLSRGLRHRCVGVAVGRVRGPDLDGLRELPVQPERWRRLSRDDGRFPGCPGRGHHRDPAGPQTPLTGGRLAGGAWRHSQVNMRPDRSAG